MDSTARILEAVSVMVESVAKANKRTHTNATSNKRTHTNKPSAHRHGTVHTHTHGDDVAQQIQEMLMDSTIWPAHTRSSSGSGGGGGRGVNAHVPPVA
jgi:hypothetical protein